MTKVLSGTSGHLLLPGFYNIAVSSFRSFPWWMQHNARLGFGNLMKNWTGRQVAQKGLVETAKEVVKGE